MDYLRSSRGHFYVVGVHDTHYVANSVEQIDANLADLAKTDVRHYDIDRLLDARNLLAVCEFIFGESHLEQMQRLGGPGSVGPSA